MSSQSKDRLLFLTKSVIIFLLLGLTGCDLLQEGTGKVKYITIRSSSFTLAWDNPHIPSGVKKEDLKYNVFRKKAGQSVWNLIERVPFSETPHLVLSKENLEPGHYAFAVSLSDGYNESDKHKSTEHTADPVSGWTVQWIPTQ